MLYLSVLPQAKVELRNIVGPPQATSTLAQRNTYLRRHFTAFPCNMRTSMANPPPSRIVLFSTLYYVLTASQPI